MTRWTIPGDDGEAVTLDDQDPADHAKLIEEFGAEPSLSDAQARVLASLWHDGMSSALYKLSSTGYIDGATQPSIERLIAETDHRDEQDRNDLHALLAYVEQSGFRQPIPGWSELWDDEFENARSDDE